MNTTKKICGLLPYQQPTKQQPQNGDHNTVVTHIGKRGILHSYCEEKTNAVL